MPTRPVHVQPYPLESGQERSANHILIRCADSAVEGRSVIDGMTLNTDEVIQIMTAVGAGWGDPKTRDRALNSTRYEIDSRSR